MKSQRKLLLVFSSWKLEYVIPQFFSSIQNHGHPPTLLLNFIREVADNLLIPTSEEIEHLSSHLVNHKNIQHYFRQCAGVFRPNSDTLLPQCTVFICFPKEVEGRLLPEQLAVSIPEIMQKISSERGKINLLSYKFATFTPIVTENESPCVRCMVRPNYTKIFKFGTWKSLLWGYAM